MGNLISKTKPIDGWRIVNVDADGPCGKLNPELSVYFDFIIGIKDFPDLDITSDDIFDAIKDQMNEKTILEIYNIQTKETREITVTPTQKWRNVEKMGCLGLQIEPANFEECRKSIVVKYLVDPEKTKSDKERKCDGHESKDGLLVGKDFILGLDDEPFTSFTSTKLFSDALEEAWSKDETLSVYVYNEKKNVVRSKKLVPTDQGICADCQFELKSIPESKGKAAKLNRLSFTGYHNHIKLQIHYDGDVEEVMVKKAESLKIALDTIRDEMELNADVENIDCMRLWDMNVARDTKLCAYDGDLLDWTIYALNFHDGKHLLLEVDDDAASHFMMGNTSQFHEHPMHEEMTRRNSQIVISNVDYTTQFKVFDFEKKSFEQLIDAKDEMKVEDLREEIEKYTNASDILYFDDDDQPQNLKNDSGLIKDNERLSVGRCLYPLQENDAEDEEKSPNAKPSTKEERFGRKWIQLKYTLFDLSKARGVNEVIIPMQKTATIGQLRQALADKLSVERKCVGFGIDLSSRRRKLNKSTIKEFGIKKIREMWIEVKMPKRNSANLQG